MRLIAYPLRFAVRFSLVLLLLVTVWPATQATANSTSGSGTVSVEIVPPESPGTEPAPPMSAPGTLSVAIIWMPDPGAADDGLGGVIAVQDHRTTAYGWTVRLQESSSPPHSLASVTIGAPEYNQPMGIVGGIQTWDVSVGASLAESPQIVTAPVNTGYALTLHGFKMVSDHHETRAPGDFGTLVLCIPTGP